MFFVKKKINIDPRIHSYTCIIISDQGCPTNSANSRENALCRYFARNRLWASLSGIARRMGDETARARTKRAREDAEDASGGEFT